MCTTYTEGCDCYLCSGQRDEDDARMLAEAELVKRKADLGLPLAHVRYVRVGFTVSETGCKNVYVWAIMGLGGTVLLECPEGRAYAEDVLELARR